MLYEVITATTITTATTTTTMPQQPININTASLGELASLPGMNSSLAQQIITFRTSQPDGFTSTMELLYFIDNATYNAILPYITT